MYMKVGKRKIPYVTFFRMVLLLHHILLAVYSGIKILPKGFEASADEEFSFKIKFAWSFITVWNMAFQILFLVIALIDDCSNLYPEIRKMVLERFSYLRYLMGTHGYVFTAMVFPFSLLTAISFWSLYWLNFKYIAPLHVWSKIPSYSQVGSHFVILFLVITELLFSQHALPNYRKALMGANATILLYISMNVIIYCVFGRWMYSILEFIDWRGRLIFGCSAYAVGLCLFHVGAKTQHLVRNYCKQRSQ